MCEKPGTEDSKIPWLKDIYYIMSRYTIMQEIPVLSMLFSIRSNGMGVAYRIILQYIQKKKSNSNGIKSNSLVMVNSIIRTNGFSKIFFNIILWISINISIHFKWREI